MARLKPPYWVRWVGTDAVAVCNDLRSSLNEAILGMLTGDRADETVTKLQRLVPEIERLKDSYLHQLQNGIAYDDADLEFLLDWLMKDGRAKDAVTRRVFEEGET